MKVVPFSHVIISYRIILIGSVFLRHDNCTVAAATWSEGEGVRAEDQYINAALTCEL